MQLRCGENVSDAIYFLFQITPLHTMGNKVPNYGGKGKSKRKSKDPPQKKIRIEETIGGSSTDVNQIGSNLEEDKYDKRECEVSKGKMYTAMKPSWSKRIFSFSCTI